MMTKEQAPWTEYLVIKKNGERRLKLFTPLKIRKKYREHIKYIKNCQKNNIPIAK
jgi:hypothetical protein